MTAEVPWRGARASVPGVMFIVLALLSGCVTDAAVEIPEASSSSENERPTPTPTVTETPEAADPRLVAVPLSVDCDALVSVDTLYDFNPNVGIDPAHVPTARGAEAISYSGVSCGWVNQTSGDTLTLALARFERASLDTVRETAAEREGATAVDGDGDAWIRRVNGVGALEMVTAQYWIVVESRMIVEASDADVLIDAIVATLP